MKLAILLFGFTFSTLALAEPSSTFGGYGEVHYNRYEKESSRTQMDLHRFVLFFGHRFDDRLSFNSEVEIEHAMVSAEDDGELEMEQAYIDYQLHESFRLRTGLFLIPMGFINPSHEPPTFYGVERNEVETRIIPSTWREGGISLGGSTGYGLTWETGVVTGFNSATSSNSARPLSGMKQELSEAKAHDLSVFASLNYQAVPGLTVGGSYFTGNTTHGNSNFNSDNSLPDLSDADGRVSLGEVHARWSQNRLDIQALYAKGMMTDAGVINDALTAWNAANTTEEQYQMLPSEFYGWLAQVAYKVWEDNQKSLAPFVRYEEFNSQAKMPTGYTASDANKDKVWTVGLSFKPHSQVVFKADLQKYAVNERSDRVNLGVGYMF